MASAVAGIGHLHLKTDIADADADVPEIAAAGVAIDVQFYQQTYSWYL